MLDALSHSQGMNVVEVDIVRYLQERPRHLWCRGCYAIVNALFNKYGAAR